MCVSTLANERSTGYQAAWWHWLWFLGQVILVVIVASADDVVHGLTGHNNVQGAIANADKIVTFEAAHDLWIEPAIQTFFTHTHAVLGTAIGYAQMVPIFNAIYGLGHVGVTFLFALWMYLYRRPLFRFVRNIFLLTNVLAIMIYEVFPLAPPRLAKGLRWEDRPYHFIDTIFGAGSGLKMGFNEFAAMPSLHVGWALIVALTLFMVVRRPLIRLLVLCYPILMMTTVIVTGNHYLADGLGAALVLSIATILSLMIERWGSGERSILDVWRRLDRLRYGETTEPPLQGRAEQQGTIHRTAA